MRTLVIWANDTPDIPTLPVGTEMAFLRPTGESCDDDDAYFLSLSVAERLANSTPALPNTPYGWDERNCGGSVLSDDWKIFDPGDGSGGFISEDGTGTNPTTPTNQPNANNNDDPSGWQNLGINQSNQNVN